MYAKECIAMILAGGRGARLGSLTRYYSKPTVHFGGKRRIIDFTLSNCNHSKIDTIGILSQYLAGDLHAYVDETYEFLPEHSDIYLLPPENNNDPYKGTADAVYKNIGFVERFSPENVLILSGDHIYNMDYNEMLDFHKKSGSSLTVASTRVPVNETSRFGIINADKDGRVYEFEEKPLNPRSCLASMGIYIFRWNVLKQYLLSDNASVLTRHDFGGDILPKMLRAGESIYTYGFNGYWRDVGTVVSLLEANMDLLDDPALCRLPNRESEARMPYINDTSNFISRAAAVSQSIIAGECSIFGKVEHSVLSDSVTVSQNAEIVDSFIMPNVHIGKNAKIYNAVIGTGALIMDNAVIGADDGADLFVDREMCAKGVSLVSPWAFIAESGMFQVGSHVYSERSEKFVPVIDMWAGPNNRQRGDGSVVYHVRREPVYHKSVV